MKEREELKKDKVVVGAKYKDGILLVSVAIEYYQPLKEREWRDVHLYVDYDDYERIKRKKVGVREAEIAVPSATEEPEIKIFETYSRESQSRDKYLIHKIAMAVATENHESQRKVENTVDELISELRQLYDSPPTLNQIAKEVSEKLREMRKGEEEVSWWYTRVKEPISASVILADMNKKLMAVSSQGKVSKDSPYAVISSTREKEKAKKIESKLSTCYRKGLALNELKKIIGDILKEEMKGASWQYVVATSEGIEYLSDE